MDSIHLFLKKINALRLICLDIFGENILCLLRYLEKILSQDYLCVSQLGLRVDTLGWMHLYFMEMLG